MLGQCAVANKFLTHPTLLAWLCNLGADGVLPGGDRATMTVCVWECMCVEHIRNGLSEARVHSRRVIRAHSYLIKRVKKA